MDFEGRARIHSHLDIAPLIDIVFLLVIFFLAATHFVRSETFEEVNLPQASEQKENNETARQITITVTADRVMTIGGKVVDLRAAEEMIFTGHQADPETFEVRIRTDKTVPYKEVEPLMIACAKAGVSNVAFAVEEVK